MNLTTLTMTFHCGKIFPFTALFATLYYTSMIIMTLSSYSDYDGRYEVCIAQASEVHDLG